MTIIDISMFIHSIFIFHLYQQFQSDIFVGMVNGIEITIQAPVNIALIKYWGKRNEDLILPMNDSISVAIDELFATTRVSIGPHIEEDVIVVNGKAIDVGHSARFQRVIQEARKIVSRKRNAVGEQLTNLWHIKIDSKTNFPTAAGLASSAAGFAAIAFGLGQLFHLREADIVRLARIGSGSACRSILSGFVHWKAGNSDKDDLDCVCETIEPALHWPELRAVIVVVSNSEKKVGSSEAMRNTIKTSELLKARVSEIVPKRVERLREAIRAKYFPKLAEITMAESNQLHAICLDTQPPITYLNATSHALIEFVHEFNTHFGIRLAYTFDAGPNCCLFMEEETLHQFMRAFSKCFTFDCQFPQVDLAKEGTDEVDATAAFPWPIPRPIQVEQIIVSKVGTGPRVLAKTNAEECKQPRPGVVSIDCKML